MRKIKMLDTGEIRMVTPNIAHDLIDGKKAEPYSERQMPAKDYKKRVVRPKKSKYGHRQMRVSGKRVFHRKSP